MTIITDPRCGEYGRSKHPETPQRVLGVIEKLRNQKKVSCSWTTPELAPNECILRAHEPDLLRRLENAEKMERETPAYPGILEHARRSAGGALAAMRTAIGGQAAFSLMRPPGHHASRMSAQGYCYLNSMAIAVLEAIAMGAKRVAVFDFDTHHCDGTESILLNQFGCMVFSVHQYPSYPGTGRESRANSHNYPVPPKSHRAVLCAALRHAWNDLLDYQPDLIGISAGFDAYKNDPVGEELLEVDDFRWLGNTIGRCKIPMFHMLEGGYSENMPHLVLEYLMGLNGNE
jgi:acetoin utilization deacetylase AcuC-like enzyme